MRARHLRGGRLARGGAAEEIPTTGGDDDEQDALTLAEPVVAQGSARPVGQDGCDVGGCEEFVMTMDVSVSDAGRGV